MHVRGAHWRPNQHPIFALQFVKYGRIVYCLCLGLGLCVFLLFIVIFRLEGWILSVSVCKGRSEDSIYILCLVSGFGVFFWFIVVVFLYRRLDFKRFRRCARARPNQHPIIALQFVKYGRIVYTGPYPFCLPFGFPNKHPFIVFHWRMWPKTKSRVWIDKHRLESVA